MSAYDNYSETAVTTGIAVAIPVPTTGRRCRIQTNVDLRMRTDGVAPTTTTGWHVFADGQVTLELSEGEAEAALFIAESASGVIRVWSN